MSETGWRRYPWDADVAAWSEHAGAVAAEVLYDPNNRDWYRGEGTWFAGVDCLPNDESGRLTEGPPLKGLFVSDIPVGELHPAQVSAVFPGYPKPMAGESAAASRFRRNRDGAHVDGLLPIGADRRRMIREPHAYVLGLPLTTNPPGASPLVVWEGSQHLMRRAFAEVLADHPVDAWQHVDLTDVYHATRRAAFETCRRIELPGRPGEAVLLDPMILHGIAPWNAPEGPPRVVAYFRPMTGFQAWLDGPPGPHASFPKR